MASPFHYSASVAIDNISNISESDDDLYGDDVESDRYNIPEEYFSELSETHTEMDAVEMMESDYEDFTRDVSTSGDTDSVYFESINGNDTDNSLHTESEIELEEDSFGPATKKIKLDNEIEQQSDGDESVDPAQKCPICLGAWTVSGEHRLCSLRCGHIFGYRCINQWLSSENQSARKCPQCNARASTKHIRFLYATKLSSVDNSEVETMKKHLTEVNQKYSKVILALDEEKKKTRKYKQMYQKTLKSCIDSDVFSSD